MSPPTCSAEIPQAANGRGTMFVRKCANGLLLLLLLAIRAAIPPPSSAEYNDDFLLRSVISLFSSFTFFRMFIVAAPFLTCLSALPRGQRYSRCLMLGTWYTGLGLLGSIVWSKLCCDSYLRDCPDMISASQGGRGFMEKQMSKGGFVNF